ncbi:MAG: hypothetical protein AB1454_02725 [Candidatus Auribacterota bacterium]
MHIKDKYLSCSLLLVMLTTSILMGCGRKEEKPGTQKTTKDVEYFSVQLQDGSTIQIDANAFGLKELPAGGVVAYDHASDERHLIDDRGEPLKQPVYRHQLLMESQDSIDNLITYFFPVTPHVVNRRKRGGVDSYVRLVSTKDVKSIRELDKPYIVIDMRMVYPEQESEPEKTEPMPGADEQVGQGATAESDQISALKSRLDMLNKQLSMDTISIPERRRIRGEVTMLQEELVNLEKRVNAITKIDNNVADTEKKGGSTSVPIVKIKIISYNLREE